jgi:hypothetical protein
VGRMVRCWRTGLVDIADTLSAVRAFRGMFGALLSRRREVRQASACLCSHSRCELFQTFLKLRNTAGFFLLTFPGWWCDMAFTPGLRAPSTRQIWAGFRKLTFHLEIAARITCSWPLGVLLRGCTVLGQWRCIMYVASRYMRGLLVYRFATWRRSNGTVGILVIRHARTCRWRRRRWTTTQGRV